MDQEKGLPVKRLFGRRKGRPLRVGRARLMDELLPKLKIEIGPGEKILPETLYARPLPELWMEIGFGGGEHLAAQAALLPDVGFIGCEPFVNGVASLLVHIEKQGLSNVRIYPDDARHVLDALPDGSLGRCFVLFADPWPKKRHAERRFIGRENLDRLARVMKVGAELRLATDAPVLADWMCEQMAVHESFTRVYEGPEAPADWVPTRYEQKARKAGRAILYGVYRRN